MLIVVHFNDAVSSVNALELDAVDAAFETELRDVNQFEATSPEGLVILNMDPLGKSRHFEAESTGELHTKQVPVVYLVAGDAATLPHSELKIMWKKSRPARQVSLQSNVAVGKSTDQSYVEANDLVNQLSNDDITVESDGSGDNQFESLPEMSLTPAMPRLQQGDIHLTPESGYSPSSTLPKIPKSPATIENAQKKTTDGLPNTDKTEGETMGAISAEERESSDTSLSSAVEDNGKNSTIPEDVETKEMNSSSESRSNERTTTVVTSSEDQEIFVSDDTLEISDQPESRLPSGRSLDEASIIPVNLGKVSNETSLNVKSSQTKKFFEKPIISKEDSRYSKNVTTLAISPKNSPTSGTTFPRKHMIHIVYLMFY